MVPLWLPTNTRPPATLGCAQAEVASGYPNAHLSLSRGTCSAVSPACASVWKRVLVSSRPQPFQAGPDRRSNLVCAEQRPADAPATSTLILRPERYSATARRSAPPRRDPCSRMAPETSASMIASGEFSRKVSTRGARESAASLWQEAQERWNTAAPSGAGACANAIPAIRLSKKSISMSQMSAVLLIFRADVFQNVAAVCDQPHR